MISRRILRTFLFSALVLICFPVVAAAVVTIEGTVTDGDPTAAIRQLQGVEIQVGTVVDPTAYGTWLTDVNGDYLATVNASGAIRLTFVLAGYVTTFGDYVIADGGYEVANAALAPTPNLGDTGTITGDFIDATDSSDLDGIELRLCEGINQLSCTDFGPEVTDANGDFTFAGVTPGTYTLRATDPAGNYNNDSFNNVVAVGAQTTTYPSLTLNPVLAAGEIRIILSWDENPRDLDSHLWTPFVSAGSTTGDVWYGDRGDAANAPYAWLDRDDTTSYGPETITITESHAGSYEYKVHKYAGTGGLEDSGAEVKVFDSTGMIGRFRVPRASRLSAPDWWWVFTYEYNGTTGRLISRDSPNLGGSSADGGDSDGDNDPGSSACFIEAAAGDPGDRPVLEILHDGFRRVLF